MLSMYRVKLTVFNQSYSEFILVLFIHFSDPSRAKHLIEQMVNEGPAALVSPMPYCLKASFDVLVYSTTYSKIHFKLIIFRI